MSQAQPRPIPTGKRKQAVSTNNTTTTSSSPSSFSSVSTSSSSRSSNSSSNSSPRDGAGVGCLSKARVTDSADCSPAGSPTAERFGLGLRRPSLMGSSLSKSEHTVINLGHSDGPPRLVGCIRSSQGWSWNQELFLPSYADYDGDDLEHRQDPVEEIILTDEEAAAMLPQ